MDKVQKIRKEVERLKSQLLRGACSSQIAMETMCKEEAYNEVLAILDIMQEEPKQCMYSKDNYTEEDRKVLCEGCEEKCKFNQVKESAILQHKEETCKENGNSLTQEPVSEDLEEAAKNHAVERYRVTRDMVLAEKCKWSFQTGAKWKEKQMMSKAVDAHVNYAWSGLSFGGFDWSKTGLDIGDKCKLIIIKED